MMMELIPPTLEDMGFVLWGSSWREPMAVSFNITDEQLATWENDPASIPADAETRLLELCIIRSQEIGMMHDLLQAAGLRRAPNV